MMRTFGYVIWALSVVILAIGGISRLTFTPFFGVEARAFLASFFGFLVSWCRKSRLPMVTPL